MTYERLPGAAATPRYRTVGYPATSSGVDIKLPKLVFTPEEARIARHFSTLNLEPAGRIYRRVKRDGIDISREEFRKHLDGMVRKGTILVYREGYKEPYYKNTGMTAGGVIDFQVNRLTKELMDIFHQYLQEHFTEAEMTGKQGVAQLRTVPVARSIPLPEKYKVATYDDVHGLLDRAPASTSRWSSDVS